MLNRLLREKQKMKYWYAKTKNGNEFSETGSKKWDEIQDEIIELALNIDGQRITLPPNMEKYVQAKTASADLNGNNVQIESRYISFKIGNSIIRVRVNETNGNVSIEVD